jgi:hypothetical protein
MDELDHFNVGLLSGFSDVPPGLRAKAYWHRNDCFFQFLARHIFLVVLRKM